MSDIKAKVNEIVSSGKCKGLMMLKNELGCSELDICKNLDDATILPSESFDKVWQFLTTFDSLLFFIEKCGNIFELPVKVGPGKEGMGYFNLMSKEATLHGHLKKESIKNIAFLKLPFLHLTSFQIVFLGEDGNSVYNFYLSRTNHEIAKEDIQKFDSFVKELKN